MASSPLAHPLDLPLPPGKKVYFASDFHLGVPDAPRSQERERLVVRWLDEVKADAAAIFLLGDIFDFWFEYRHAIPKGFVRLQGRLAELVDSGIPVIFFTGNHDMWMFDYFPREFGIPVYHQPQPYRIGDRQFLIGHGDGLGPGDRFYKILKKIFRSRLAQWLFARIHPNSGIGLATFWSRRSRLANTAKGEEHFRGEDREWLLQYCREIESQQHFDYYIFGHRHLVLDLEVVPGSRYLNLGEWVNRPGYAVFDGQTVNFHSYPTATSPTPASL